MRKNACSSNEKINKMSFLSMIGAKKFIKPNLSSSFQEQQMSIIKKILDENQGNKRITAAKLGLSLSSLNRKLNKTEYLINDEETESPSLTRRYFEKLNIDWEITSFDYKTREVCINLKKQKCTSNSCSPPVNLSVIIPNFK